MMSDNHHSIRSFLSSIHPINEVTLNEYLSFWSDYSVPARTTMTAPGEVERYMYFVTQGLQKSFYEKDDKQHVIAFTYPPSFSGIPESFLTQTPSKYYLESITESRFIRISHRKHNELLQENREIETLFRKATEMLLMGMIDRHYELMALDIKERFSSFAKRSPHLFGLVPHKDLASYLRIDPTNFSKLYNSIKI